MPRWAMIGWLLKVPKVILVVVVVVVVDVCQSPVHEANAKLALFWDWLHFDRIRDNFMHIGM